MKRLFYATIIATLMLGSYVECNAQLISISVNARGYKDLKPANKQHFVPFSIDNINKGMNPGDPIEEITGDDIKALSKHFDRTVIVQNSSTCKVMPFSLAAWQQMEDTLHAHNSRLVIVTARYDEYDSLEKALEQTPISFKIYVLSGKKYSDNYFKMGKLFWKEMVGHQYKMKERFNYYSMLMVRDKNGLRGFVPNIDMVSYN